MVDDDTMHQTAARSLAQREAAGLRAAAHARIGMTFLTLGGATVVAGSWLEVLILYLLGLPYALGAAATLRRLTTHGPSRWLGWAATCGDAMVLCALPVLWHGIYSGPEMPLVHLLRHQLLPVMVCFLVVSSLSLRPAYPLFLTLISAGLLSVLTYLAVSDPALTLRDLGVGVSVGDLWLTPVLFAAGGVALTRVVLSARHAVKDAVRFEAEQAALREAQLRLVLDQRIEASAALVAGIAHELNTPLGALHSGASTAVVAVDKLAAELPASEGQARRTLQALRAAAQATGEAAERIAQVVSRLRRFVRLDEATRQHVDVAECLRNAAALVLSAATPAAPPPDPVPDQADGDTREQARDHAPALEQELEPGAIVLGDPARLTQALATVIENAVHATQAGGRVLLRCYRDGKQVQVHICDTGPGMDAHTLSTLFDVEFGGRGRTKARFGLAACRSIIHSHGGDIAVDSHVGEGTTFRIRLPAVGADAREQAHVNGQANGQASRKGRTTTATE